jgi:hypothetical protein
MINNVAPGKKEYKPKGVSAGQFALYSSSLDVLDQNHDYGDGQS